MNACLWCDDPTEEQLCAVCRAAHDHPLFVCAVPGHLPTHGPACATCAWTARAEAERAARVAPILASLEAIRARHLAEWGRPWPGLEFGKVFFGRMLDTAIEETRSGR